MKILVVDDSLAMRMIVKRTLRQAGFGHHQIDMAANGREGLEAVKRVRPDVIMSDWNMPEMTGIEFLRALRAGGDQTRFGFVTSEGTPEMRGIARDAGALFLIVKPFTPDVFRAVLTPMLA